MGWLSGIISSVSSFLSSVVAPALSKAIDFVLDKGLSVLEKVSNIIVNVGKAFGLIKPEENPEDYGDRAL
ncbi:MAG: hypothetical protein AB7S56_08490 [Halothiobacillaceae bacterium]